MGAIIQRVFLGKIWRKEKHTVLPTQKTLLFLKGGWKKSTCRSPLKLWAQFVLLWRCLQARLLGNSYRFSLKIVPLHVTFVLCCRSQAENMPTGVLITHIHTSCGRAGKRQLLQGYSTTKHFLYHVFLCKHKRFPLHLSTWLFSPMFPAECRTVVLLSHMELWEVLRCGTKKAHNPA